MVKTAWYSVIKISLHTVNAFVSTKHDNAIQLETEVIKLVVLDNTITQN